MGQINSSNIQNLVPNIYSEFFNKEPNTLIADEIKTLTREKFLELMIELNSLCRDSSDEEGKQMAFAVKKGSDETILWKSKVEIACIKVDPISRNIESYRILNLSELLKVFYTLKCQSTAINQSEKRDVQYDEFLSSLDDEDIDMSVQCCICFERKHELSLPCTHSFCTKCIEEWNSEHDTCPICRDKLDSTDETWVLSEKPDANEISKELRLNLTELSETKDSSCVTS